jgi:outer membrane protein OmpA-like peptidoglycan-associated protein
MRKFCFLALVFGMALSVSSYSQTGTNGEFFFSGGFYFGFFPNGPVSLLSGFELEYLNIAKLGGNWEMPAGPGYVAIGLEAGYASGSRFGGKGAVDFIPVTLNTAYTLSPFRGFSFGPSLKLGGLFLNGQEDLRIVPMVGPRFEIELAYKVIPVSLYGSGGVDLFPGGTNLGIIPTVEVGLRFRRVKIKKKSPGNQAFLKEEAKDPAQPVQSSETGPVTQIKDGETAALETAPSQAAQAPGAPSQSQTAGQTTPTGGTSPGQNLAQAAGILPVVPGQASQGTAPQMSPSQTTHSPGTLSQAQTAAGQGTAIVLEGGIPGILRQVFFQPDSGVPLESSRASLEIVGRELAADPSLRLLLRTYTAYFGSSAGRKYVSELRADFCRDYLTRQDGVAPSRIVSEIYGSERTP